MNSFWQTLTLSTVPFYQWRSASFLHRLLKPLRRWRSSSFMLEWGDLVGAVLVSLVFAIAPFVSDSKDTLGILLIACAGFWLLLTLSDEPETGSDGQTGSDQDRDQSFAAVVRRLSPVPLPLTTPIHLIVLIYWGISVVATGLSPVKRAALVGLGKLTLYLILFALMARVLRSPRVRSVVITVYLLAALAVSAYGLQQWFSGAAALATWVDPESPLAKTTRVYSYLGNPNLLAAYLVPAITFSVAAIFVWQRWLPKLLALLMVVVNGACLILTFSRGGWIGMVVSIFVLALLLVQWWNISLPKFWRVWSVPIAMGTVAGVVVLAVLVLPPLRDRASSIFLGRGDSSNNYRINVWYSVIDMIKARPILGIGPGNVAFNQIYPIYQRPRFSALSAYSVILEVAAETGIIGLTCFIWLLLVTFNLAWDQFQKLRQARSRQGFWLMAAIATLIGMLGHGMFDTVLYRPQVNTLWWLMFALIASYYSQPAKEPDHYTDEWA
ncbi:IctB family putative bicarbonate transporter [Kovacikia minuta CCNUW1]|uniref:IctB family putative bicarbonate transporter n=1 Tax=Kovacikia minuta TaxID=2931930 RepID=UPI001CCC7986|nr:IctB family putative bicarbonate transporter [Kovacikia minuta]UBF29078.1 IctB family putative bicarbonate transporter [Kovacikia minuta CCNUW1]